MSNDVHCSSGVRCSSSCGHLHQDSPTCLLHSPVCFLIDSKQLQQGGKLSEPSSNPCSLRCVPPGGLLSQGPSLSGSLEALLSSSYALFFLLPRCPVQTFPPGGSTTRPAYRLSPSPSQQRERAEHAALSVGLSGVPVLDV